MAHSAMHFGGVMRFVTMSRGPGNDVDEDERAHTSNMLSNNAINNNIVIYLCIFGFSPVVLGTLYLHTAEILHFPWHRDHDDRDHKFNIY